MIKPEINLKPHLRQGLIEKGLAREGTAGESFKGNIIAVNIIEVRLNFPPFFSLFPLLFIARKTFSIEKRGKMSRKSFIPEKRRRKKCKQRRISLTKENARVFLLFFCEARKRKKRIFLRRKLNENSSLGKIIIHRDGRRCGTPSRRVAWNFPSNVLLSMRGRR